MTLEDRLKAFQDQYTKVANVLQLAQAELLRLEGRIGLATELINEAPTPPVEPPNGDHL